ncbi:uncharacterized protein LOC116426359 [Nomia melanderi]|uniref:uncharacterized protein LOC116426359 n=1 Tax=Nomia melanderi TaxID=2448451 RepID=UPI003FCDBECF
MEEQTKRILFLICLVTFVSKNFLSCTEISSQINLDSKEDERSSSDPNSKDMVSLDRITGRTEIRYLLDQLRQRTTNIARGDLEKISDIINNIHIIINGQEIKPSADGCQNRICKVSMSSTRDDEGNIITDVHLRIITKSEVDSKVNEIPVVDGFRGVEDTPDHPVRSLGSTPHWRNYIPQIQTRFQNGEPWYQGERAFQRPQIGRRYHFPTQFTGGRFPQYGGRPAAAPVVDDKIEPPLSKTQGSNE